VPAVSPPPASVAAQPSKRDHQRDERQHDRAPTADEHSSTAKHVRPPVGRAPAQPRPHRRRAQPRGHIEGAPDRGRRARRRQTGASGGGDDNDAATHHTHPSHRSQLWCRQRRWWHGHTPNPPEQGRPGAGRRRPHDGRPDPARRGLDPARRQPDPAPAAIGEARLAGHSQGSGPGKREGREGTTRSGPTSAKTRAAAAARPAGRQQRRPEATKIGEELVAGRDRPRVAWEGNAGGRKGKLSATAFGYNITSNQQSCNFCIGKCPPPTT